MLGAALQFRATLWDGPAALAHSQPALPQEAGDWLGTVLRGDLLTVSSRACQRELLSLARMLLLGAVVGVLLRGIL